MEKKNIAVLAYNYGQYAEFKGNEQSNEEYVYIDRPEKLLGRKFSEVAIIGNFWDRPDAGKLYEEVERRFPHLVD